MMAPATTWSAKPRLLVKIIVPLLVATTYHLEDPVGSVLIPSKIAQFIDHKERRTDVGTEFKLGRPSS